MGLGVKWWRILRCHANVLDLGRTRGMAAKRRQPREHRVHRHRPTFRNCMKNSFIPRTTESHDKIAHAHSTLRPPPIFSLCAINHADVTFMTHHCSGKHYDSTLQILGINFSFLSQPLSTTINLIWMDFLNFFRSSNYPRHTFSILYCSAKFFSSFSTYSG